MKKINRLSVLLAVLLTMTVCTGCGSASEPAETLNSAAIMEAAPAAEAPKGEAVAGADAGEAVADVAADDADAAADDAGAMADGDGIAEEAAAAPEAFGSFAADAVAGAASFSGAEVSASMRSMDTPKTAAAPAYEEAADEIGEIIIPEEPEIPVVQAEAGILTAGEWNDHANWGFFSNLVNNDLIQFPSYGLDPTQRIAVKVSDEAGELLPNAKVTLTDADGSALYRAVTDKSGMAYLFETGGKKGVSVAVSADGAEQTVSLDAVQSDEQGGVKAVSDRSVEVQLSAAPVLYPDTQVMFIVDTTGSMGDEMLFLQSDFGSIAEEIGDERTSWSVNFYKDNGDEYVTKGDYLFTTDTAAIKSQLNAETADGGGDEPEAVAEALLNAFSSEGWAEQSAKVAFLIFDAPPHTEKEADIQQAISLASEKGIHLVPVVSSNGSRSTELFGRAAAICTNGTYVFLTDDSGVGGSHLEPIIGDYEVEKLHDVIVRIIQNTRQG